MPMRGTALTPHRLHVRNRTRAKAEDLAEGARPWCDSVAGLRARDRVHVVAAPRLSSQVTLAEGGPPRQDRAPAPGRLEQVTGPDLTDRIGWPLPPATRNSRGTRRPARGRGRPRPAATRPPRSRAAAARDRPVGHVRGGGGPGPAGQARPQLFLGVVIQSLAEITGSRSGAACRGPAFPSSSTGSVLGSVFTRYRVRRWSNLDLTPSSRPRCCATGLRPRPGRRALAVVAAAAGRGRPSAGPAAVTRDRRTRTSRPAHRAGPPGRDRSRPGGRPVDDGLA